MIPMQGPTNLFGVSYRDRNVDVFMPAVVQYSQSSAFTHLVTMDLVYMRVNTAKPKTEHESKDFCYS